jgi:6-pyruvoyltetrahydropterin/6-carboxytetrahydropterin synthase
MIEAVRIIKFDAGHRVVNHESKCASLHGHEYKAHIYAQADALDALGRVIDFSVIKDKVGTWIDTFWDHTMIIFKEDPDRALIQRCGSYKPAFISDWNPTAENMAMYLLKEICPNVLHGTGVKVSKIRLYETSNCYVEVTLDQYQ